MCGAETESLIRDLTKESYRDGFISSIVWSSSFQNFAKYCASSALKKVKFLTKGISVGSSGTRPVAAAAASSGLSWNWDPSPSVTSVAGKIQGVITGAWQGGGVKMAYSLA